MNPTKSFVFGLLLLSLIAAVTLLHQPAARAQPAPNTIIPPTGTFQVDPVHSSLIFKIKHYHTTNFFGRFDALSGSFSLGDSAAVTIVVQANSVDTNNAERDRHARSADFLSVADFPQINFTASNLAKMSPTTYQGRGALTFHGVTKPIDFTLTITGSADHGPFSQNQIAGVQTTFTIKRSDFGCTKLLDTLSDSIELTVALEGQLK